MRIVEEGYLKRTVAKLNSDAEACDTYGAFYERIESLSFEPLQDLSFQSDLKYFDEIAYILSVIASIAGHPHISTEHEDIVLRTEFANAANAETFRETLRDPRLWKKDGAHMVPEYVHYHQSVDDLCIYENRFIVMLVKLLAAEIGKYESFYSTLIQTFCGQDQLSLDEHNVSVALSGLRKLNKKIGYIQNTRFYQTINRKYTALRTVHPTNILLKDRLYNLCFKFYRSLITYPDKESLLRDFSIHYYMLLLRSLRAKNFVLCEDPGELKFDENKALIPSAMKLENALYRIELALWKENRGIVLTVEHKLVKYSAAKRATHLLIFSPQSSFADLEEVGAGEPPYTTVEAISLWNMAYVERTVEAVYHNPLSEEEVMDEWLSCKLSGSRASVALYRTFCPACQKSAVNIDENNVRHCAGCGSSYAFFTDGEGNENLWFLKLRRNGYGKQARA